jgi:Xaa-Pro aminopeptidase
LVLIDSRSARFYTDGRYTEQAAQEVTAAIIEVPKGPVLIAAAKRASKSRRHRLGFEAEQMSVATRQHLGHAVGTSTRLKAVSGLVEGLRVVKDSEELDLIREAVRFGSKLLPVAYRAIKHGVTETRVAAKIEYAARSKGASGMSFETIVASGLRSALPHGVATTAPIPAKGFVILDFGVILHGYCSDMTRTVHIGRATGDDRALYQAVLESQLEAISACKPGATMAEVDGVARGALKRARLDKFFTHSTGHGLGLEIHEQPRLAQGQDQELRPGMVVTIEPGAYIPGRGGVRIEDVVVITEAGYEVLTPAKKDWLQL